MTAAVHYVLSISLLETDLDYIITGTLTELLCVLVSEKMWDDSAVEGNQEQEVKSNRLWKIEVVSLENISGDTDNLFLSPSVFNA